MRQSKLGYRAQIIFGVAAPSDWNLRLPFYFAPRDGSREERKKKTERIAIDDALRFYVRVFFYPGQGFAGGASFG
jgi:hypothetical protein